MWAESFMQNSTHTIRVSESLLKAIPPSSSIYISVSMIPLTVFIYTCLGFCMEKAMAPHSSTLAWKVPWMEEPGRLQSMRSLRVRHN